MSRGLFVSAIVVAAVFSSSNCTADLSSASAETRLQAAVSVRSWTIDQGSLGKQKVSQTSFPLFLRTALPGDGLRLSVYFANTLSEVDAGETSSLDGPTDTRVRLTYHPAERPLLLSIGFNLPTGKTRLSGEEAIVSRAVSSPFLDFQTNRIGEGFDVSGNAYSAWAIGGRWCAGIGAGFTKKGSFEYRTDASARVEEVSPGDELLLTAGASFARREEESSVMANLDATVRVIGSDEVQGEAVFKEGSELNLTARVSLDGERWRLGGRVAGVIKGENALRGSAAGAGVIDTRQSVLLSNVAGDNVRLDGTITRRITPVWDFGMRLAIDYSASVGIEGSSTTGSAYSRSSAQIVEVGPSLAWRTGKRLSFEFNAAALTGSAEDGDVALSGFDARLGTELTF